MTVAPEITGDVRAFVDALPDPMWVFDRHTLRILLVNPAAGHLLGHAPEALLHLTIADLRLPEDVPALHAALAELESSEVSGGIWRLQSASGTIIHADFHWKPIRHDGRDAVLASVRDVTRLVTLEQERTALLASAEEQRITAEAAAQHFREIFESAPGKFLVLTPDDHRIVAVSNAYCEATLTQREDIVGRSVYAVFPDDPACLDPEGDAALRDSFARAGTEGLTDAMGIRRYPIALPAQRGGGHEDRFWSIVNAPIRDASGQIAYVVHRVEDVTDFVHAGRLPELTGGPASDFAVELLQRTEDLQLANAQLREKEANLRTAQRLLDIGIWKLDLDTGKIWWSENVADLCGLPAEQAPRDLDAFVALLHPDDQETAKSDLEAYLASGATHFEFQHRVLHPDGRVEHMQGVAEQTGLHQGRTLVGVIRNVSAQIEAARELARQNELLQIAGTIAQFGGWHVSVDSGIVDVSKQAAALHGLEPGQRLSVEDAIAFYIPEHRVRIRNVFRACIENGEPYDEILRLDTATGRRIWVRSVGMPVRDDDGTIIAAHGALQDISDIVAMRDRTEELAHGLMRTLENMSDAVVTLSPDWRFTFVNSQAERVLKRSRDSLIGRVLWDVFPDAVGTVIQREYEQAMATGKTARFEVYYPATLDSWFEVNAYPSSDGLGIYFRDISERHRAEEALRRSEERFRMVTRATDDMIWDWDVETGTVWTSDRMIQVLGLGYANASSDIDQWESRIHPDDVAQVRDSLSQAMAGGAEHWQCEYRHQRADGTYAILANRAVFLRDKTNGRVARMIGSAVDVTETRASEGQLRRALRLEAVGQLTGGLAHDFNNLLTIILGNAELLSERLDTPRLNRMAQQTVQAAERGAELTNRLLAFARQQPLAPRAVDLVALLRASEDLLKQALSEEIEFWLLTHSPQGGPPWSAQVDPNQLELAILNLVINARDAMSGSGRLTIGVDNLTLDAIEARSQDDIAPGDYVAITITDTGTGMPPEVVERVFEPFFTTKPEGKGSGLGLSMVYGFVKQSGGHVSIDSEPGRGTAVRLFFRRATVEAPGAETAEAVVDAGGGAEHILVVEDDLLVREYLVEQLQSLGYRVSSAPDGPHALKLLNAMTDLDLLLTDVVMPGGLNGRQLADLAMRQQSDLRVLFTSGYSENTLMQDGRLDDGVELLKKPFRRQDLAAKVRRVLDASKPE